MKISDEAVQAAVIAMNTNDMVAYDSLKTRQSADAKRILTSALPFLTGVKQEPIGYLFQHEDTGLTQVIEVQQVELGFEKNNPRWQKISPVYSAPVSSPSPRAQALEEALQKEKSLSDRLASALEYIDDYCLSYPDLGTISAVAQPALKAHSDARALSSQPVADGCSYRILEDGETIEATDEYLEDDAVTWTQLNKDWSVGGKYHRIFKPMRRPLPASPGASE